MKRVFKAFALVTAVSVATRLMSFLFKIYLSRELGAEVLGLYQIVMSVLSLMSCVGSSGLSVTLSRFVAEGKALGDRRGSDGLTAFCLSVSAGAALLFTLASLAFPTLVSAIFSDKRCVPIFYACLPLLLTTSAYATLRGWFWGNRNYGVFAATELLDEISKIVLSVLFISGLSAAFASDNAYAYALVAGDVVVVVVLAACYFIFGGRIAKPRGAKKVVMSAAPLTATRLVGSSISTLTSLLLPALLVSLYGLTTEQATAEFGRASGMVMPLLFTPSSLTGSLAVVLIPELASMSATGSKSAIAGTGALSVKFAAAVSSLFFIVFCSCGVPIGELLYADPKAGEYLTVAAAAMIPMCVNGICTSVLNSLGKETLTFVGHTAGAVTLAAVMSAGVAFFGIYAYFIAMLVSQTLTLGVNLFLMCKYAGLEHKELLKLTAQIAFAAISAFALSQAADMLENALPDLATIAVTGVAALAFCAAYLPLSSTITKDEVRLLLKK